MLFGFITKPPLNNSRALLLDELTTLNVRLEKCTQLFNMTDEPELTDAFIYEELSLRARYSYLLRKAKELGISVSYIERL